MAKPDPPLRVEIPDSEEDRPAWSRVGIIGAAGFLIGIAWPRALGVQLGPSVPSDAHAVATASAKPSSGAPPASAAASTTASAAPAASGEPGADNRETVVVSPGKIIHCWDKKDRKVPECDKVGFDPVATSHFRELASCPSALGLEGTVVLNVDLKFEAKKKIELQRPRKGGGSTLPPTTVRGIVACAAKEFSGVGLDDVAHKYRRYALQYTVTFYPPGKRPEGEAGGETEASGDAAAAGSSGTATVVWETALLRKEPTGKDGEIVSRLVHGTRVKIVGKQGDWYRVESGNKSGWVYRSAIGM